MLDAIAEAPQKALRAGTLLCIDELITEWKGHNGLDHPGGLPHVT